MDVVWEMYYVLLKKYRKVNKKDDKLLKKLFFRNLSGVDKISYWLVDFNLG